MRQITIGLGHATAVRLAVSIVIGLLTILLPAHRSQMVCAQDSVESSAKEVSTEDSKKLESEQRLNEMRNRAFETKLHTIEGEKNVGLRDEPLVRYSDQPRGIADGTLWAFPETGRPVAVLKIETYRHKSTGPAYLFSMCSLSSDRIRAEWSDGHRWTSTKPGLDWQTLPNGPSPADTARGRLTQMKGLIRRISTLAIDPGRGKEVQRLLPQPIYRYSDTTNEVIDGVIFAFTSNGTNPSALGQIELRMPED